MVIKTNIGVLIFYRWPPETTFDKAPGIIQAHLQHGCGWSQVPGWIQRGADKGKPGDLSADAGTFLSFVNIFSARAEIKNG